MRKKSYKMKWFLLGMAVLLLSGCGEAGKQDVNNSSKREVSYEVRYSGRVGLLVEEGELKESSVVFEDAPIDFQDEVVEEMLRNLIGKPEGEVYISELQEIHAIYWRNDNYWSNLQSPDGCLPHVSGCEEGPWDTKQPETLADFAYCYNLQWMEFGRINVPSLKPLWELPQLEALSFESATITEEILLEIGGFPFVNYFEVGVYDAYAGVNWGTLTDGSFLLPIADQLVFLKAYGGIDWNPKVLSQMKNMEILSIDNPKDVSFLNHMPKLEKLHIYCGTVEDWSPLAGLDNLKELSISGNDQYTVEIGLSDVSQLKNLDYLELWRTTLGSQHSHEEIVEAIPSLTQLYLVK
ncbi:MAG: hypothetical protein IJ274_10540 [Lachnospiraceae bacterium]|nr:hypothetical protein [Lachnospiraceae bacterium]